MVYSGARTTTTLSADREIDFAFASSELGNFVSGRPIYKIPWGPHCGILYSFAGNPRTIESVVLCVPKALPMHDFKIVWGELDIVAQHKLWSKAKTKAKRILKRQKAKTGVAILGKPALQLNNDIKFQGELKAQMISNGEYLAYSSLASEILILETLKIPHAK
jgi:hypothetical protein